MPDAIVRGRTFVTEDQNKESVSKEYLLRTLTETEMTRLEEKYFANHEAFEQLEIAEDELVDAYVRNNLSSEERMRFEKNFLALPRVARRVAFAKTLVHATSRPNASIPQVIDQPISAREQSISSDRVVKTWSWKAAFWRLPFLQRAAFASVVLVIFIGGLLLFVDWLRLRQETRQLAAARDMLRQQNQELLAQKDRQTSESDRLAESLKTQQQETARLNEQIERNLTKPPQAALEVPVLLFVSGSRGGGANPRVKIPATPSIFALQIVLEADEYQRYAVTIKTADERVISGPHELKPRATHEGKVLVWKLSSTRFTPNDYIVTVSGITPSGKPEEIAAYTFQVSGNASSPKNHSQHKP